MSESASKIDPVRQMLMHFGGHITMVMAQKGFMPEQVSAGSNGVLTTDEVLKIMTGSNADVPVSKLAYVAGLLDVPFGVGISATAFVTQPVQSHPGAP
jgi:hypothetical protein